MDDVQTLSYAKLYELHAGVGHVHAEMGLDSYLMSLQGIPAAVAGHCGSGYHPSHACEMM